MSKAKKSILHLSTPVKSKGDPKQYRLIQLENGLTALLVSAGNDNEPLAAASLTVRVGSFDEPPDALGLAHFLEHMVHMGSAKYPGESEFNDFLSANGGMRNANTSCEMTSYFFNVAETAFADALDRFAQMFESPSLQISSMQREREAMDSEFNIAKSSGLVGLESVLKLLIVESNSAGQFDFGNLKTLKEDINDNKLHCELINLHKKYSANKMYLAIQSGQTLDQLEQLVVDRFCSVKAGPEENQSLIPPGLNEIFKPEFYDKIYYIKSKTPLNALFLTWTFPPIQKHYKCSPFDYIAHIFFNDGEDGIRNYLRELHYATDVGLVMEVNAFSSNSRFALVRVYVDLTVLGYNNIDQVLKAVASYLLMMKETPMEEHRRLYQELKEKTELDFDFYKESSSLDNVSEFAANMLNFDQDDILRGNSVFQNFDDKTIGECIEGMNARNFNMTIITDIRDKFEHKEKYFETEYDFEDFPEKYEKIWREKERVAQFSLEKPNPFKATDFTIYVNEKESHDHPKQIRDDAGYEVWHSLDKKYNRPHVYFRVQMVSPIVSTSKKNYLMMTIFGKILKNFIYKKLSQASSAGYDVRIITDMGGLTLNFEGFSQKISMVIDTATGLIRECLKNTDEQSFEVAKAELSENFANVSLTVTGLNNIFIDEYLYKDYFNPMEFPQLLNEISYNELEDFVSKFLQKLKVKILAQGNITNSQTLEIVEKIQINLHCEQLNDAYEPKRSCYQIPSGSNVIRVKSLAASDANSYIKDHYQIGRDTLLNICYARLIAAILNPKAFDFLRTKEQLGYSVFCQVSLKGNTVGLEVAVSSQEHKNHFSHVADKMKFFMSEVAKKAIEELSDAEFQSVKEARLKLLLEDDPDLDTEVETNWYEIKREDFKFDRIALAVSLTRGIFKSALQEFFRSFTRPMNTRKLSVQVIGNLDNEGSDAEGDNDYKIIFFTNKLTEDERIITDIQEEHKIIDSFPIKPFEMC